jgi:pimeloyl-ACP methyl ester carboxylesterase
MQHWSFTEKDANRITQPVLAVIGELSLRDSPITVERQELLLSWLPNVEACVLPDAGHLMQVQNPNGMAERLSAFFARHQLPGSG